MYIAHDLVSYYQGIYKVMLSFLRTNFIGSASILSNEQILYISLVMYLVILNK